jgi:tetratricopeptide (TPR) repeat protein
MAMAERFGHAGWLNGARYGLGQACYTAGRLSDAAALFADLCQRLDRPEEHVPMWNAGAAQPLMAHMMSAMSYAWLGRFEQADARYAEALGIAARTAKPYDAVAAAYGGGLIAIMKGEADTAVTILERAIAACERNEIMIFLPVLTNQLGQGYLMSDRPEAAREMLLKSAASAETIGHTITWAAATAHCARALKLLGDDVAAVVRARRALETTRSNGYAGIEVQALCALAEVLGPSQVERAEALVCLDRAIAISTEIQAVPCMLRARAARDSLIRPTDQE